MRTKSHLKNFSMDANTFEKWIHEIAKSHGYRRKGKANWIKITPDSFLFINLQRDTPFNYINLGVLIRSLVPEVSFENFKWNYHCLKRADCDLGVLLDLSAPMDPAAREYAFKDILATVLIPQLDCMGTIDGIKAGIQSKIGFNLAGEPVFRLLGLELPHRPRFTYTTVAIIGKDGVKEPVLYELWERNDNTGETKKVDSVYTIEEADNWIKQN